MGRPFRLGLIGCGLRGVWYLYNLKTANLGTEIVAFADTDKKYSDIANKLFAGNKGSLFSSGESLIENCEVDGVIIASPNDVHRGPMVLGAQKHLKMLLEKPVATTTSDFAEMWKAYQSHDGQIVIGFCLRYTPFYSTINEIIRNGDIGEILAINAEELMSDDLSMAFNRGDWRPNSHRSGGLLLEKCCHDMDIINWMANSKVESVFSHAKRTFLKPQPEMGPVCSRCKIEQSCRFSRAQVVKPFETEWPKELHEMFGKFSDETCAYRDHYYPDHQTVNIAFENGILCNFTVAQAQPATRRTLHILGSKGRVYGVVNDNRITVYRHNGADSEEAHVIDVHPDKSGHNGGDSVLTNDFFRLLQGNPNRNRPGLAQGIEAAMICLAAEQSVASGQSVYLKPMREAVFGTSTM
jgi:predicted dehydrogenase